MTTIGDEAHRSPHPDEPTGHPSGASIIQPLNLALMLAEEALAKKAFNPVLLEVSDLCSYADYLLIVTATSAPQAGAIADGCMARVKQAGLPVVTKEGLDSARWILIDFGDVVLHVFQPDERGYYDLETLWVEAPRIDIPGVEGHSELQPVFATR